LGVEKRKEVRLISRDMSKGELYHPATCQYFTVEKVRDVSSMGIGLSVNGFLRQGEQIRLGFKHGRSHLQMYGYVAWCSAAAIESTDDKTPALFMMGISL